MDQTTMAVRCAHEAAHGVAAVELGGQIHRVEVNTGRTGWGGQCLFTTPSDHDTAVALAAPAVATRAYLAEIGLNDPGNLGAIEATCRGDRAQLPALTSRSIAELEAAASPLVTGRGLADVLAVADLIVAEDGVVTGDHPELHRIQFRQHPDQELATATTEGRITMSIDDVRSAIAEVEQRVSTAAGQLATVRGELDEAAGLLAHVSQGSNAAELSDALGQLRSLSEELGQAGQRAINTSETALSYAGRL